MTETVLFDRVALIGVGLIGSSLARALRRHGLARSLVGCSRTEKTCADIAALDLTDHVTTDPGEAVAEADLVVIGTPVGVMGEVAKAIGPALKPGCIVTDVGSVKEAVLRDVCPHMPDGVYFIPGHPIAGTENSGPAAGFPELFHGRWCILTPSPGTPEEPVARLRALWEACGSMVEVMTPEHHDKVLAITSHLPHLIAYTIVDTANQLEDSAKAEVIKFSASGFRDFTRIAASDPVMWRDVFLNNKDATLEMLQRFSEELTALQRAIRWGDGETLHAVFTRTRDIRRSIIEAKQA